MIKEKGLLIDYRPVLDELLVKGDELKLKQVLINLISNGRSRVRQRYNRR